MSWTGKNMAEWCEYHKCDRLECPEDGQLQVQIVVTKRIHLGEFDEVFRTDPVYCSNGNSGEHINGIVASIERYAKEL